MQWGSFTIGLVTGGFIGGSIGAVTMAMLVLAKRDDEERASLPSRVDIVDLNDPDHKFERITLVPGANP